jgi:hypothetical protein
MSRSVSRRAAARLLAGALAVVFAPVATAAPPPPRTPPPRLVLKELRFAVTGAGPTRRVRLGVPPGWTGDRDPDGRALRLFGPEGEGKILLAAVTHPSELGPYLSELRAAHPAAAPSPPELLELPGVSSERGERATRFVITGEEVGEMVMLEKASTIVLVVTVVTPEAWTRLAPIMRRAYPTLEVLEDPR